MATVRSGATLTDVGGVEPRYPTPGPRASAGPRSSLNRPWTCLLYFYLLLLKVRKLTVSLHYFFEGDFSFIILYHSIVEGSLRLEHFIAVALIVVNMTNKPS